MNILPRFLYPFSSTGADGI